MIKKALLRALVAFAPALGLASVACTVAPAEDLGVSSSSIIGGVASDASQNFVVLVMIYFPSTDTVLFCTGSLLTSQLVLTARHCVSQADESAACDANGNAVSGGAITGDYPAANLSVFTGQNLPDFTAPTITPAAIGGKIVTDGTSNICNHDYGLIELQTPITNMPIAQVRLESTVTAGDVLTTVGWGVTSTVQQPPVRQQRTGVAVIDVGPMNTANGALGPNEFDVGESICSGDSGGPAIASSGAIVGVVSRGGNGNDPEGNPASACEGANTYNLYEETAGFKDTILAAAKELGQNVWEEGQPDPRLTANNGSCTTDASCQSNHCVSQICAQDCSKAACPSGYTCNSASACVGKPPGEVLNSGSGGCSTIARKNSSDRDLVLCALAGVLVLASRRKKRR